MRKKGRFVLGAVLCAILVIHGSVSVRASSPLSSLGSRDKKVTLLSIPGFSFVELAEGLRGTSEMAADMPHLEQLKHSAAWGAMNIRTSGRRIEDVYVTLGAGQWSEGLPSVQAMEPEERIAGESSSARVARFSGEPARAGELVVPDMELLKSKNAAAPYQARPGLLGERLKEAGVRPSVWGNLDQAKIIGERMPEKLQPGAVSRRFAPLMLVDRSGRGGAGKVDGTGLLPDPMGPYGLRTDYAWMLERWREQAAPAVVLLELGDLHRLYEERAFYSDAAFARAKRQILADIDRFVGSLAELLEEEGNGGELWLFSPQVNPEAAKEKAMLAPVMRYAPDGREGLLVSATTRRSGLVSAVDMAPTLLETFAIVKPVEMIGLSIREEALPGGLDRLLADVRRMQEVYALRPPLLYGLAVCEITIMLGALATVWKVTGRRTGLRGLFVWRCLLFSLLLAPAGLLLMGWMPAFQGTAAAAAAMGSVMAAGAGLAAAAARIRKGFIPCLACTGIAVSGLILYDGLHGATAMKWSVLGYDPMIGARYYGIGNEFMGVLLGAALLGLTALQQALRLLRRPRPAAFGPGSAPPLLPALAAGLAGWHLPSAPAAREAAWPPLSGRAAARAWAALPAAGAGALVAGYLASPALGTNAGGALAAAAGFGALTARLAGGRSWLRLAPALALLLAAALAGVWLLNAGAATDGSAERLSHIGRALETLRQGRLDVIGAMVERKLAMNWHLIGVSAWSKVLLTGLAVMAALVLRPRGPFRRWQRRYPYLMYGVAANVIGTIAALLLNDSGIVAAATMIVYGSIPLLLLKMEGA